MVSFPNSKDASLLQYPIFIQYWQTTATDLKARDPAIEFERRAFQQLSWNPAIL
jgi:hypothetical protein